MPGNGYNRGFCVFQTPRPIIFSHRSARPNKCICLFRKESSYDHVHTYLSDVVLHL